LGVLDSAGENNASTRDLCRENGWLNYDTLSGYLVAANKLATNADEAVFWSGIGRGGDKKAAAWVANNGGSTLETTLASRNIQLPKWNASDPSVVAAWERASVDFANGASGNVRVLQGDALRIDAIFGPEFRALTNNPSVNSIKSINPDTGLEVLLWSR
jgi:filamentous hemagglutinin